MNKSLLGLVMTLMLGSVFSSYAQQGEFLTDLSVNPWQDSKGFRSPFTQQRFADQSFIYQFDTLEIDINNPFLDDFSGDKFKRYDAQVGDANVLDTTLYNVYIGGNVASDTISFRTDTTWLITVQIVGIDTITTQVAQASQFLEVRDNCVWPSTSVTEEVWPSYNIIDTAFLGTTDTIFLNPQLQQDSITLHIVSPDGTSLWVDNFVYVNGTYPIKPPTINVATFDGLNEVGKPYDWSLNSYGQADYLTSTPINLQNSGLNCYLSFFYQGKGLGNPPNPTDSLVVEFLNGVNGEWERQWTTEGMETPDFNRVFLKIEGVQYQYKGFQFRFRNKATLSGAVDHWHIDYVELAIDKDTNAVIDEVAFVYPLQGVLENYSTMPWTHYKADPDAYMADNITTTSWNLNTQDPENIQFRSEVRGYGNLYLQIDSISNPGGNNGQCFTRQHKIYQTYQFILDTAVTDTCPTFEINVLTKPPSYGITSNDTVSYQQTFWNQYAYDDGSAESGYSLVGTASKMANRYYSPFPDTLTAIYMYFNPFEYDASNDPFRITVWDDDGTNGGPGTILSQNDIGHTFTAVYGGIDKFTRFELQTPIVVSGNFYVGLLQLSDVEIGIGFDLNTDHSAEVYYNIDNMNWNQTSFNGSLMIRPGFKTTKDYLLNTPETLEENIAAKVYPNPSNGQIRVEWPYEARLEVYDLGGRIVDQQQFVDLTTINLSGLESGIYLLRMADDEGHTHTERVVLQSNR